MSVFNPVNARALHLKLPKRARWSDYDRTQRNLGFRVELEHTTDPVVAAFICAHHLDELPDYYTRLRAMEAAASQAKRT